MRTLKEILAIVEDCSCSPYEFQVGCVQCERLQKRLPGESLGIEPCQNQDHSWFIQAKLWRRDTITGLEGYGYGNENLIHPNATLGEIVKRAFVCARDYGEHEVREGFKYKGRRVLGPHIPVELLYEVANRVDFRAE